MNGTTTVKPDVIEQAFSALNFEDRVEIVSVGAAFHRLTLQKRLERADHKVREFEAKYQMTFEQLEAHGLPDDADYAIHEDYVEWHYWSRVHAQTRKALDTLALIAPEIALT